MSIRNEISGLLGFVGREDIWRQRLQDTVAEHLVPALEEFEVDHDELPDLLGDQWSGVLWGCGFEDFLGRRYGDENIVDLFLKRRGWKETVLNRAYFAALRDTPVSLYEVSEVQPGKSMVLRDVLTDAQPVAVQEMSATRSLKQWDRIAVRVVVERDHHVISGALLPFSADAVELLFGGLRDALKLKKRDAVRLTKDQLLGCAPIFTGAWLFSELQGALSPDRPEYCNSDGDDVMFHDLRFPFASGVTQKELAMRLDRIKGLAAEGPKFWNWLAPKKRRLHKAATGIMLDSQMDGRTVLGGLVLKGKALQVSVNSTNRAMQIEALVMEAAGDLLKTPLTTIRSIDQMMAEQRRTDSKHGDDEIPPQIAMRIAHDYMDKHYRETLDAPLPALGGKSPRQAVGTAAGREKVIEWLKLLENRSARQGENPIGTYDFSWMWTELGLSEDRR